MGSCLNPCGGATHLSIEIDMLAVGDADAMALRHVSDEYGEFIAISDGGHKSHGNKLVSIVRDYYQSDTVDLLISTHPDQDHIAGLEAVLDALKVKRVWVHDPSEHPTAGAHPYGRHPHVSPRRRE